jgi:hypothetical protein
MTIDRVATLEWSFQYCTDPQDGPPSAVFGAPLPYERWNGVSSLQYEFAPHLYVLNIVLVSIVLFPAVRYALVSLGRRPGRLAYRLLKLTGVLLLLTNLASACFALAGGLWQPVFDISHPPYDSYTEFRPVRATLHRHYDCTPSSFWFGPHWRPK